MLDSTQYRIFLYFKCFTSAFVMNQGSIGSIVPIARGVQAAPTTQWSLTGVLCNASQRHLLLEVFDEHTADRHQEDFVVNVRQEC